MMWLRINRWWEAWVSVSSHLSPQANSVQKSVKWENNYERRYMTICFFLSVGVVLLGCVGAFSVRQRMTKAYEGVRPFAAILTPLRVVAGTTALALFILLLPTATDSSTPLSLWTGFCSTLYLTFRVFIGNAEIREQLEVFRDATTLLGQIQSAYTILLYAVAPLLAIGFVLTFLQAFSAHVRYFTHPWREVNVFSELNERSIALATSIRRQNPHSSIVFTEVVLTTNEPSMELIGRARALGALCFKSDILSIPLHRHSKKAQMSFFVMSSDDDNNLHQADAIIKHPKYSSREETDLYLFSDRIQSQVVLKYRSGKVRVHRISYARLMVYDWLWRTPLIKDGTDAGHKRPAGVDLFHNALPVGDDDRAISVVILGLGRYGTEMLKALSWYCQMDSETGSGSYRLTINAYDDDPRAEARFKVDYPELATCPSPTLTKPRQDAQYEIHVHGGVDTFSPELLMELQKLDAVTFIFVALGDDARNLEVAARVRQWLAREGQERLISIRPPQILAVTYDSQLLQAPLKAIQKKDVEDLLEEAEKLDTKATKEGISPQEAARLRYNAQASYRVADHLPHIELIGDINEVYSYDTINTSLLIEHNGWISHMMWAGVTNDEWDKHSHAFWNNEYYYTSSIPVPIHWRARRMLGLPGADPISREDSHSESLSRLEHARWNAFLRSEGFIQGTVKDLTVAKTHPLLCPFDDLPDAEKNKDQNDVLNALDLIKKKRDEELALHPDVAMTEDFKEIIKDITRAEGWVAENLASTPAPDKRKV